MRYACLIYLDGRRIGAMDSRQKYRLDSDCLAHNAALADRGHAPLAQALQSPDEAVTLRRRGGAVSMTEGPFVETKEHLGGMLIIEAASLEEASAIAAEMPLARIGSIEVRPVWNVVPVPA